MTPFNNFYMFSEKDYIVNVVGETNLLKARESVGWGNEIVGYFQCINGKLTSLEGAPIEVGEEFSCTNNVLSSLDFSPIRVGNNFLCYDNPILSIAGFGQRFVKRRLYQRQYLYSHLHYQRINGASFTSAASES